MERRPLRTDPLSRGQRVHRCPFTRPWPTEPPVPSRAALPARRPPRLGHLRTRRLPGRDMTRRIVLAGVLAGIPAGFKSVERRTMASPDGSGRRQGRPGSSPGRGWHETGRGAQLTAAPVVIGTNPAAWHETGRGPCCASAQGPRTIDRVISPPTGRAIAPAPGSASGAGRAMLARGHAGARKVR